MEITRRTAFALPSVLLTTPVKSEEITQKWNKFDHRDKTTWPTKLGFYAVMVSGDSESIDGHEIYSFPDYQTFAYLHKVYLDDGFDGEGGHIKFNGIHDEDEYTIFAYYGPIEIPKYQMELCGWTGKKCPTCNGLGITNSEAPYEEYSCPACAGTGDEWGLITK